MAKLHTGRKVVGWIIFVLVIALGIFCYFKFFFVFSDGTKTGELNQVSYTGLVFKTYEGTIILTGYGNKSGNTGGVQSNEYKFSAKNKEVFEQLSAHTGERVTVHYKKYYGRLPWRGHEKSIVDEVLGFEEVSSPEKSLSDDILIGI